MSMLNSKNTHFAVAPLTLPLLLFVYAFSLRARSRCKNKFSVSVMRVSVCGCMNGFPFIFAYDTQSHTKCQYYCKQLPLRNWTAIWNWIWNLCAECFGVHYAKDDDNNGNHTARWWWRQVTISWKLCKQPELHALHLWCKVLIDISCRLPLSALYFPSFFFVDFSKYTYLASAFLVVFSNVYCLIAVFISSKINCQHPRQTQQCQQQRLQQQESHTQIQKCRTRKRVKNGSEFTEINWNELMRCTLHTCTTTKKWQQPMSLARALLGAQHIRISLHLYNPARLFICLFIQCLYFGCNRLDSFHSHSHSFRRYATDSHLCDTATNLYFCKNIFKDLFKMQIDALSQRASSLSLVWNCEFNKRIASVLFCIHLEMMRQRMSMKEIEKTD